MSVKQAVALLDEGGAYVEVTNPLPVSLVSGGAPVITTTVATVSSVASSAVSGTLIAANANRKGLNVHNNSTAVLYLRYGAAAAGC